ncbi:MAG TPA: hypothetical protein VGF97_09180 [Rhizomicrobium sp.]|jgi:hypothetical protein
MARILFVAVACLIATEGCADLPNVAVTYYPPIAHVTVEATQSLQCDKSETHVLASTSVKAVTTWTPDHARPHTLRLAGLDGAFSDTNVGLVLTEDGRLKGVNAQTTGEAAEAVSAGVSLVSALTPLMSAGPLPPGAARNRPTACTVLADWGKGKPAVLVWRAKLDSPPALTAGSVPFDPAPESRDLADALADFELPQLSLGLRIDRVVELAPAVTDLGSADVTEIALNKTAEVDLSVIESQRAIWAQGLILPVAGDYMAPIPKSKLFGTSTFSLAVSDSGAVTSVSYAKTTGIPAALGAASSVTTAVVPAPAPPAVPATTPAPQ